MYYHATDAGQLLDVLDDVSRDSLMIDSDNDGLPDYYEKLINDGKMTFSTGVPLWDYTGSVKLSWNNPDNKDSDGDGLMDGEEITVAYIEKPNGAYKYWIYMYSNPCLMDSDGDGINDRDDPNPLKKDTSGVLKEPGYNKKGKWSQNPDSDDYGDIPYVYSALERLDENWKYASTEERKDISFLAALMRTMGDDFRLGIRAWFYGGLGLDKKGLTDTEKVVVLANPTGSLTVNSSRDKAWSQVTSRYREDKEGDLDGSNANAFLHCYWNALISKRIGADWAQAFTDAHEYGVKNNYTWVYYAVINIRMDLFNNHVGTKIGTDNNKSSDTAIADEVQKYVNNGFLRRIKVNGVIQDSLVLTNSDKW